MTRSKRFIIGLASSYAAIGVNIFYTIASIPLALHYLDKEEFGLWALVIQFSGYLMLLEFGMTGSVARSLSDHKDEMETGVYGNILRTGARVFSIQGVFVALLGLLMAWLAPSLLKLPDRLHHPFAVLMVTQALISGFKLAAGSYASPLWCHQRLDLSSLAGSAGQLASFVALWLGFHFGWHVYSLTAASLIGFIVGFSIIIPSCKRLGFYPPKEFRGKFDPVLFRELLGYGSGLFLMNLGTQLASASQVIVASRMFGMEAVTVWSIATKVFTMAQQFVGKIFESSAGGLAEMLVRSENQTLQKRFRDLVSISAIMAAAASAGIALINSDFIWLWTSGKVQWQTWNDLLLGCLLFSTAVSRCHIGFVGVSKEIRGMKYICLAEGVAFVILSVVLGRWFNLTGLLAAAVICNIFITGIYGVARTSGYFGISRLSVIGWVIRPASTIAITAALYAVMQIPVIHQLDAVIRLSIGITAFCLIVVPVLWWLGVSPALRYELSQLVAKIFGKLRSPARTA